MHIHAGQYYDQILSIAEHITLYILFVFVGRFYHQTDHVPLACTVASHLSLCVHLISGPQGNACPVCTGRITTTSHILLQI